MSQGRKTNLPFIIRSKPIPIPSHAPNHHFRPDSVQRPSSLPDGNPNIPDPIQLSSSLDQSLNYRHVVFYKKPTSDQLDRLTFELELDDTNPSYKKYK